MKLIMCDSCQDIFNLSLSFKQCSCGKAFGMYLEDRLHAKISEHSIPIGFLNNSFDVALSNRLSLPPDQGYVFTAFIIPDRSSSIEFVKSIQF